MSGQAPRIDKIESGSGTLYMGVNPEVGGSTPFQLVTANKRHQVLSPTGAITVKLPTTGIALGETWKITNTSTNVITIQSSDGSAIVSLGKGSLEFLALQNVPTGSAHWSNLGLLGIVGRTDGVAPAAGMVGEFQNIAQGTIGNLTSAVNINSITLKKGIHDVSYSVLGFATVSNAGGHFSQGGVHLSLTSAGSAIAGSSSYLSAAYPITSMRTTLSSRVILNVQSDGVYYLVSLAAIGGTGTFSINPNGTEGGLVSVRIA